MDQDPVAKLDAFGLTEEQLFSLFDRERAIKLARVVSTAAFALGLVGVLFMIGLIITHHAETTNFIAPVFGFMILATTLFFTGWWFAYHDDQFGAAIAVVSGMLIFTVGFQCIWEINNGLDGVAVALFMLTALPIGLSGVLGEPKLMFVTTGLVIVITCLICFVVPGHERMSVTYRIIIAVVTSFVQGAIAGCIILAAMFYISTLQRLSIIGDAYRQIRRLDAMKEDFIRNVNHELRTPFMTLSITTEMLYYANNKLKPEERASYLEMAFRSIERLHAILDTVLNFQRIGVGVGKVATVAVPVRAVVDDALALTQMVNLMGSHPLHLDVAENLYIWGNAGMLQETLVNLLSNAHKYSDPTSPIEIVAYKRQSAISTSPYIELRVRDFGLGIPSTQAHLLFQRLSRLPRDIESNIPGSGLGLALCKMLIEAMGGTIRLESMGRPGAGTVVIITLPTPPPEAAPRPAILVGGRVNGFPDEG